MSAQITHDPSYPFACKRCGGLIYQHVDFCPYCGTDRPLDTVTLGTHPKATLEALGPTAAAPPVPAAAKLSPAAALASDHPTAQPGDPHQLPGHALPFGLTKRWILTKGLFLFWLVLMFGYATYLLLGDNRKQDSANEDQSTHSSGGSVSTSASRETTNATLPPAADTGAPAASPPPRATPQYTDVADSLRVARRSLAENNLFDAKAANSAALARDPDNEDARTIQRDIAAREQRRDNALQGAERCAAQHTWACAQQQASEALAIDSSSQHAQSLLERAIVATAWKPLGSPNSTSSTGSTKAPNPANPANGAPQATTTATANPSANAGAANAASNDHGVDAQERAILQNGWKPSTPTGTAH
ncbi:zinc ribbon domain-containing protein [Paraburkholderia unamae]|uniref:Zinc ribbon protein n=1 Tax=Paraburkholderia unamae TaxID=219649 RepID=A0ABX5K7E0_9BURK|nr:zinc ribbon domain-containing protein [Paraburkholderia unamae]PVX62736.1 hypothetical protein C7402_13943 [Paraburkholderia unamae]